MNNLESNINFVYFLTNGDIKKALRGSFNDHLYNHFLDKLKGFIGEEQVCRPQHIIKLVFEMSRDNQLSFMDWINKNYNCGFFK